MGPPARSPPPPSGQRAPSVQRGSENSARTSEFLCLCHASFPLSHHPPNHPNPTRRLRFILDFQWGGVGER
eukprot:2233507-Pyramimonas_sp.AAC.1